MCRIIFLEDSDAIDPAKRDEETGRRAGDDEPCRCTTVGKGLGIHPRIGYGLLDHFSIL